MNLGLNNMVGLMAAGLLMLSGCSGLPERRASAPAAKASAAIAMGDVWYGYQDFAKAAGLYKVALTKPGVDADLANLRLGASLAQGGDKAGALAALNNVKNKPYADLATFWKVWIGHPATS